MNKKISKLIIIIIIIVFISSYLISESGYYEYTMQQRTIITNEKIKEFEEDIKNNKDIDLKEYLDKEEIDYSNAFTNLVYNISDNSNKLARKAIKYLFKKLGSLVED
ncbi:MAG: hypothetical protein IJE89_05855 [Bacilli bacterium]|nr:hypothetical protein [Bacilli bacterium]